MIIPKNFGWKSPSQEYCKALANSIGTIFLQIVKICSYWTLHCILVSKIDTRFLYNIEWNYLDLISYHKIASRIRNGKNSFL